ncbi:MAG: type II toxin-antitoxin system VapC family toxin [Burkholderiales bacterium]|nr:type II toxin-antitoxin system VapC family toxin [Anaerolineae bacterium]
MKLLLDTHAFIWWAVEHRKLSPSVLAACENEANTLIVSLASIWEMQIKFQLGKMELDLPLIDLVSQQQSTGIELLPISLEHILAQQSLPFYHKDPFDRLIIAQAMTENLILVSHDPLFASYPVKLLW